MRWLRIAVGAGGVLAAAILLAPLAAYLHFVRLADTAIVPGAPERFSPAAIDLVARSLGCDERPVFEPLNVYSIWFHIADCELQVAGFVAKQMLPRPQNMAAHHATSVAATVWVTRHWSAEQALATVLERGYFGRGVIGLDAAADTYFRRAPSELTREEVAQLIAMTKSASLFDPWCRPKRNQEFTNRLLERDPATPISSRLLRQPGGACATP